MCRLSTMCLATAITATIMTDLQPHPVRRAGTHAPFDLFQAVQYGQPQVVHAVGSMQVGSIRGGRRHSHRRLPGPQQLNANLTGAGIAAALLAVCGLALFGR